MRQLFSLRELSRMTGRFEVMLEGLLPGFMGVKQMVVKALLRESTLVWAYLCHFMRYLKTDWQNPQFSWLLNSKAAVHEIQAVAERIDIKTKLVEEPRIEQIIQRHLSHMKSNLLAVSVLFRTEEGKEEGREVPL